MSIQHSVWDYSLSNQHSVWDYSLRIQHSVWDCTFRVNSVCDGVGPVKCPCECLVVCADKCDVCLLASGGIASL